MTTSNYITIPLSQNSKDRLENHEAIVDLIDSDLLENNWHILRDTYACRHNKGKYLYMHRVIMERVLGRELKSHEQVDHIDNSGLNNSRSNLRLANQKQNARNSKIKTTNQSGFKGVSWSKKSQKWQAHIKVNYKSIYLGMYDAPEDAHAAYCEAAKKHFGEFANFGD
jgi:hypothetical protein